MVRYLSAVSFASLSAASFPSMLLFPGTHWRRTSILHFASELTAFYMRRNKSCEDNGSAMGEDMLD